MTEIEEDVVKISIRLLDDAYTAWHLAESECDQTLRAWFQGSGRRPHTYFAYRAALDREEAAARDLKRLVELTRPFHETIADLAGEALPW